MYLNKLSLLLLAVLLFSSACKDETKRPSFDKDLLYGRWDLSQAWRSNRPIETLDDLFYEFYKNGKMRTNFTLDMTPGEFDYSFDGQVIEQKGGGDLVYMVDSLGHDKLIMTTVFSNYPFRLALDKTDTLSINRQ
ncbi:MAG TPA: hypothetical protein ENJ20_03335 [Bacteroidetes bacterium]|nr:hypothetical protein [Bacteroidota bacterium]